MNKPHKHAQLAMQYAQDMLETETPWKLWEFREGENHPWYSCGQDIAFYSGLEYRRKPRVILINGIEVPEPMREKPKLGAEYYMPSFCDDWVSAKWDDDSFDNSRIELGICHLTREAAELHAKALLSFTKKEETK